MRGFKVTTYLDKTIYTPAEIPADAIKHDGQPGDFFIWWSHGDDRYREAAEGEDEGYVSDWTLGGYPLFRPIREGETGLAETNQKES